MSAWSNSIAVGSVRAVVMQNLVLVEERRHTRRPRSRSLARPSRVAAEVERLPTEHQARISSAARHRSEHGRASRLAMRTGDDIGERLPTRNRRRIALAWRRGEPSLEHRRDLGIRARHCVSDDHKIGTWLRFSAR